MKLSLLKSIIMECVEELSEGPARKKRQEVGYQYKDGLDDPLKTPIKYRQEFNMSVKPSKSQYTRKKASKVNPRSVDKDYYPRKIRGSFKKLGEGTRRLDRLVNSKAHYSRQPEIRKKADRDFETSINKLRRRNKRYEEKHGQVKLANARFQRGPVKEEKKYFTKPPIKGFNRTEPMAYKKKSLSGKIASGIRKFEKKVGK